MNIRRNANIRCPANIHFTLDNHRIKCGDWDERSPQALVKVDCAYGKKYSRAHPRRRPELSINHHRQYHNSI